MSVRSSVLKKLEENRGEFFSGEELADQLSVSRASVWKAIHQLKAEGYQVIGVRNKGYCLSEYTDILSTEGIRLNLNQEYKEIPIYISAETNSTNQDAKQAAVMGAVHKSVFLSEKQKFGKGRRGRTFVSISGSSIYMSVVLRPKLTASHAILITTAASVAVCQAIKVVTGKDTLIKWVNDVYYEGKKICGILTEAVTDCETGMIESIILGIGINFNIAEDAFPEELKMIATSLYHGESPFVSRNQLIAEILNQVFELCDRLPEPSFITAYRNHSFILGSDILVTNDLETRVAKAIDINNQGGLIVEFEDGSREVLSTGEVTIRKI